MIQQWWAGAARESLVPPYGVDYGKPGKDYRLPIGFRARSIGEISIL